MAKKVFGKEIGPWSETKLKFIREYLGAYSNILHHSGNNEYYFIDGFAGTGYCISKGASKPTDGSAVIALNIQPPFNKYFFIELDGKKIIELNKLKTLFPGHSIEVIHGDCNIEINRALSLIHDNVPFIALLDPQAGDLQWETIEKISKKKRAELLINFPFGMAINRYMSLEDGKPMDNTTKGKLTKIFGSRQWEPIYNDRKNKLITPSQAKEKYLDIYLCGLRCLGFNFVAVKNILNTRGAHIYYLVFATRNLKGLEKMKESFVKEEKGRNTLFFHQEIKNAVYREFAGVKQSSLSAILEKMLPGKNIYRVQDFKDVLIQLEKDGKLVRINPRLRARSFNDSDLFNII